MFEARIEDRLEIQALVYRWCRSLDRRDWDLMRSCFHPDGHDDHGMFVGGVEDMIAWLKERHAEIRQSMHQAGNMLIEFAGPDRAVVETYVIAEQHYPESARAARIAMLGEEAGALKGEVVTRGSGRYVDIVERRDGVWRVLRRTVVYETLSAHVAPELPKINPSFVVQRRDKEDAIYRALREEGLF